MEKLLEREYTLHNTLHNTHNFLKTIPESGEARAGEIHSGIRLRRVMVFRKLASARLDIDTLLLCITTFADGVLSASLVLRRG